MFTLFIIFIAGYGKSEENIENVLDKFEMLEDDVYTDGCRETQSLESTSKLQTKVDNYISESPVVRTDSSFGSEVHIVILEENLLPDLEPSNMDMKRRNDFKKNHEKVSVEDCSDSGSNVENNIKDMPQIIEVNRITDDILNEQEDTQNQKHKDLVSVTSNEQEDTQNQKHEDLMSITSNEDTIDIINTCSGNEEEHWKNDKTDTFSGENIGNVEFIEYF